MRLTSSPHVLMARNRPQNWVGRGFDIGSIVAAVIAGVVLSGGRGTVFGGLIGAAILGVVFNSVLRMGLPIQLQIVIKGVTIVIAPALYRRRKGRGSDAFKQKGDALTDLNTHRHNGGPRGACES